jgi:thiosulfate/3-mercaptopyruvate sulfurtransferase
MMDKDRHYTLRSADEIESVAKKAGLDLARPIVSTCGSGVFACTIAFALYLIGRERVAVYDGSWTDWGARPDAPIETGA